MTRRKFPENMKEEGKEFNYVSRADYEKLKGKDKAEYDKIRIEAKNKKDAFKKITAAEREQKIRDEMKRLIDTPKANGPAFLGQPARQSITLDSLTPHELRFIRETAERNVREQEKESKQQVDRDAREAEKAFLDRVLGPDRYPSRGGRGDDGREM